MSKICIVFDRLRTEEKMLKAEAEAAGHDITMLDAKTALMGTGVTREAFGFDIVLERCVSYIRGLHFTAALESMGVPVLNTFDTALCCGNKMLMSLRLERGGVRTPATRFAFSSEGAEKVFESHGYPQVIKPVIGSWGRGVAPISDRDAADAVFEVRGVSDGIYDRIYYLQERIKRPPRDIRVITVGGEAVAAMYRESAGFKTNIALGADPQQCKITPEMGDLARRASEAVGGGILGVDMMEDAERGLLVHEVNNTVEFRGISKVSENNIPARIIEFAAGA